MICVIQRVADATVTIGEKIRGRIGPGLLLLVGIEQADNDDDIAWLANKVVNLRIFNDVDGVMNISIRENGGDILLVSQFTLHANIKKGNRPSYIRAAKPEISVPLYERFIQALELSLGKRIETGEFGADMRVTLTNDGPVTIIADSKNKV